MVDIIIPCWNHVRHTARCLITLDETKEPFRAILINNGSVDKTKELLAWFKEKRPETIIIENVDNLGFVKAMNQGYQVANSDYVLQCNNDIEFVDADWLGNMLKHFKEGVGAVGPTSTYVLSAQWHTLDGLPTHHETKLLSGFCILMSRECMDKVGFLDERFGMGGNDDLDLCIRISDAGFKLVIARDVFVKHEGSVSLKTYTKELYESDVESMADVSKLDTETRQTLVAKWGQERVNDLLRLPPEYEGKM